MSSIARSRITYDIDRILEDMSEKGWMNTDLAKEAGVSDMVISRFLRGERQTPRALKKIASALGKSTKRYIARRATAA